MKKSPVPNNLGTAGNLPGVVAPEQPPGIPSVYAGNVVPVEILNWVYVRTSAGKGRIEVQAPPNCNNGGNTIVLFRQQAYHVLLQNNSQFNVNFEVDETASAGSPLIAPGQTIFLDVGVKELCLFATSAIPINGTVGNNIVIRGWL